MADDPARPLLGEVEKALAAAERQLVRAQELRAALERGEVSSSEIESQVKRAVARDRIAGETVGQEPARSPRQAASETDVATQASKDRAAALKQEQAAEATLNRQRAASKNAMLSEAEATRRYGPYNGPAFYQGQAGRFGEANARIAAFGPAQPPPPGRGPALGPRIGPDPTVVNREAEGLARLTAQQEAQRGSMSRAIQTGVAYDNTMHRHGALTTEFIQAAQRGEVTIRELGFQTAATVGKFGAWLGAGAAVYGVLGAVTALGKGALDAYSGVNQLQRVVTHGVDAPALRAQFADLAGQFNLPISTVTDAVYQMGKVFHSQDAALQASQTVLYATKIGELDVASATKYLIAIVQGAHLPVSQLGVVFDQVNQAQNRFGITIQDVLAGLAKSTGQFTQSGGDVSHLIALITTAQRVTGNTGQVIGTAISRAPNFLRQASNQQVLESFGVKASTDVQEVITQAFKVADHLKGARLQELSAAIFGPQYGARVGTALLANSDLYDKVLQTTSPQRSRGSGQRELATQLGSINEQIQKIAISLQRVGEGLAQAHLLDVFGGIVKLLNLALGAANSMLDTFNQLPEPVRQIVGPLTQAALVIRLLRRFNLGETIAGGVPAGQATGTRGTIARAFNPTRDTEARLYRKALFDEQTAYQTKLASASSQFREETFKANAALSQGVAAQAEAKGLAEKGADSSTEFAAAKERQIVAEGQAAQANARLATLSTEQAYARERLGQVEKNVVATGRRASDAVPAVLGGTDRTERTLAIKKADLERYQQQSFEQPTGRPPVPSAAALEGQTATNIALASQARTSGIAAEKGATSAELAETELASAEAKTSRLGAALGALGQVAFAGFIAYTGFDLIAEHYNSLADQADELTSSKSLKDAYDAAHSAPLRTKAKLDALRRASAVENFKTGSLTGAQLELQVNEQDIVALQRRQRRQGLPISFLPVDAIRKRIDDLKNLNADSAKFDDAVDRVRQEIVHSGAKGPDIKALNRSLDQVRADMSSVGDLAKRIRGFSQTALDQGLQGYLDVAGGLAPGSDQRNALSRARIYYNEIERQLAASNDPASLEKLAQARDKYLQGVSQTIQDDITGGLALARTQQEANAVYQHAFGLAQHELIQSPKNDLRQAQDRLQQLESRQQDLLHGRVTTAAGLGAKLGNLVGGIGGGISDILGIAGAAAQPKVGGRESPAAAIQAHLSNAEDQKKLLDKGIASLAAHLKEIGKEDQPDIDKLRQIAEKIKAQTASINQIKDRITRFKRDKQLLDQQLQQQRLAEEQALLQAQGSLAVSQTADPGVQAARLISSLQDQIAFAQQHRALFDSPRAQQTAILGLQQQLNQAYQQQTQAQIDLFQSQVALRFAGDAANPDPAVGARDAYQSAQLLLAKLRSLPSNQVSQKQIIDAEAAVRSAYAQLQQTLYDQATQLRDAAFGIAQARDTAQGRPIAAAQDAVRQAEYDLRRAQTQLQRRQALQQLIQARAQLEQTWFQQRLGNIQFSADIDRITTEQEIQELQRLLQNAKLTREQKRQILEQIHSLKQQSDVDLDVGNIKLPTIYDVRRAIAGGDRTKNQSNVVINNNVNVDAKGNKNADDIAHKTSKAIGGHNRSAMKSAGLV